MTAQGRARNTYRLRSYTAAIHRRRVYFEDNGPGISIDLKEDVFRPFFSTKDRRRRQGLGLYIARECAHYNDAELYLADENSLHPNRLNTFVLELPQPND